MAVRVTPYPAMGASEPKIYEEATSFKRDEKGFLTILQGTKKVAEHSGGSWQSVEVFTPLDQKGKSRDVTAAKKSARKKAAAPAPVTPKTKSRSGGAIRTSPARGAEPFGYGPVLDY
jgi:hypothetical protein